MAQATSDVKAQGRGAQLGGMVRAILESYERHSEIARINGGEMPSAARVTEIADDLLKILFPGYFVPHGVAADEIPVFTAEALRSVAARLEDEIVRAFRCFCSDGAPEASRCPIEAGGAAPAAQPGGEEECRARARAATLRLLGCIPAIRGILVTDIEAAYEGDPAATSDAEIILAYPCIVAISIYRLAHVLYEERVPLIPRMMGEYAHSRTGIDLHPGARIGRRFFIDPGTAVDIGETTEIGDNVKIYQGVTLGARSFPKDEFGRIVKGTKRHPTIEDNVTIYSGATILGGDVVIGRGSVIGGNVWLMHSLPPNSRIVTTTAHQIQTGRPAEDENI
jgi:serine O-acetyltransferase